MHMCIKCVVFILPRCAGGVYLRSCPLPFYRVYRMLKSRRVDMLWTRKPMVYVSNSSTT